MFNLEDYKQLDGVAKEQLLQASTCQPLKHLISMQIRRIEADMLSMTTHESGEKFKYDYMHLQFQRDSLNSLLEFLKQHTLTMQAEANRGR